MRLRIRIGLIIFVSVSFFLFYSCKKQNACDCFKPRGKNTLDRRVVSPFSTLDVFDKIDVYYTYDTSATSYVVTVNTGENLVSNISTEVVDGVLQIRNNNKCNFVRGDHNQVTVYITSPKINYIIQDGIGTIYGTNTIKQDSLTYTVRNAGDLHLNLDVFLVHGSLYGVGDIYLNGRTNYHLVNATGQCFINAQNLIVDNYCLVIYESTGEARVNVSTELDVVINYSGNVYYTGNVNVIKKSGTGKGMLIKQ